MQICRIGGQSKIFWIMNPDFVNKSIFEEYEKHALLVIWVDILGQLKCVIFSTDNVQRLTDGQLMILIT